MSLEIEKKFIVKDTPENLTQYSHEEIIQGYICIENDREIRLRQEGNKHYLTIKIGKGETRLENEIELSKDQFDIIWPCILGNIIEKVRYRVPYKNKLILIDVFKGTYSDLTLAEIEFNSQKDATTFIPPKWFGTDVTNDERFKNKNLAKGVEIKI